MIKIYKDFHMIPEVSVSECSCSYSVFIIFLIFFLSGFTLIVSFEFYIALFFCNFDHLNIFPFLKFAIIIFKFYKYISFSCVYSS